MLGCPRQPYLHTAKGCWETESGGEAGADVTEYINSVFICFVNLLIYLL